MDKYIYESTNANIEVNLDYQNQFTPKPLGEEDNSQYDKPQSLFGAYMYNIRLDIPDMEPITLCKRYSDLEAFYTTLMNRFPFVILPSFPPKDLFMKYKKDEEKIKARSQALRVFFAKLMTNTVLLNTNFLTVIQQYKNDSKSPSTMILQSANNLLDLLGSHGYKVISSLREWTAWFEHYNKLNTYEKICENFIQFLETENTIKNQLIEFGTSKETLVIFNSHIKSDKVQCCHLVEHGHLRQQVCEHQEVLRMLYMVYRDILSYKNCLKRYFLRIKKRYYDDNSSFASMFKDDDVFSSLEKSHALPNSAKREIVLIRRQLEKILPGLDNDLRYLLGRANKAFELNIEG